MTKRKWQIRSEWTWKRWGIALVAGELDDIDNDYGLWLVAGPFTLWCVREEDWGHDEE